MGLPLVEPDAPYGHTSDDARAAASRIFTIIDTYLSTDLVETTQRWVEERARNNPEWLSGLADYMAKHEHA